MSVFRKYLQDITVVHQYVYLYKYVSMFVSCFEIIKKNCTLISCNSTTLYICMINLANRYK